MHIKVPPWGHGHADAAAGPYGGIPHIEHKSRNYLRALFVAVKMGRNKRFSRLCLQIRRGPASLDRQLNV
jgi:hypothetical protein